MMLRLMRLNTVWNIDRPNETLICIWLIAVRCRSTSPVSVGSAEANTLLYISGLSAWRVFT